MWMEMLLLKPVFLFAPRHRTVIAISKGEQSRTVNRKEEGGKG
jgi:hypothetical protein